MKEGGEIGSGKPSLCGARSKRNTCRRVGRIGWSGVRGYKRGDKTMAEKELKSVDPATQEMLEKACQDGARVMFDRAETMKPCPIGAAGPPRRYGYERKCEGLNTPPQSTFPNSGAFP
jgi:hypothetical protein